MAVYPKIAEKFIAIFKCLCYNLNHLCSNKWNYARHSFGGQMSYTVEKLEKSQVKFDFAVDADTFAKAIDKAYEKTKHKFSIAGFRKGHVPKKVIEGVYGKEIFFEDAMDIIIPEEYSLALDKETEIDVVAQPSLADFKVNDDGSVNFTLIVTVKPEVKLGAYKDLEVEKKAVKVSAKEVDERLKKEQEKQVRLVDVDREAANGDIVAIDFAGSVDGVKFEGGSAENYELELGSNTFIPGFEDQLVGVKAGDDKDVVVTFPADYQAENLAGKEAVFACHVNAVKVKELPALDDEFAKDVSEFDTLAEYKADLKKQLEKSAEEEAERDYEDKLVEKIVDSSEVEVPEDMIVQEAEDMVQEYEYRLMYQGLKFEDYLKYLNNVREEGAPEVTRESIVNDYKPQAEKSVRVRLVMEAIVKDQDLKVEDKDIDAKLAEMAEKAGKDLETYKKNVKREQIDYVVNSVLSEKLLDTLKALNPAKKPAAKKSTKKAEEPAPAAE